MEVKGTTGAGLKVTVTVGEVENAKGDGWRTDLFVVSGILVVGDGPDAQATGGTPHVVARWRPTDDDLRALTFECRVPGR